MIPNQTIPPLYILVVLRMLIPPAYSLYQPKKKSGSSIDESTIEYYTCTLIYGPNIIILSFFHSIILIYCLSGIIIPPYPYL